VYRAVEMAEHQGYNIKIAVIPKPFKDIDELINKDAKLAKKVLTEDTVSAYDFFLATALKRHDKASAMGKKYIMDELTPIFSKITNSVLIDHYTKKIAEELGLAEETVSAALKSPTSRDGKTAKSSEATFENSSRDLPSEESMETTYSVQNPEYYFVALLLKSNLDIMRKIGYNTQAEEFQNSSIREILSVVLESLNKTDTSLNISSLALQMSPATAQLFTEMCLVDSDLADDPEKLEKELNQALLRVKTDFIRNKLKKLSEEIKLAEMANDSGKVLELTKNFEELSKSIMNQ
jgi:DNA primase